MGPAVPIRQKIQKFYQYLFPPKLYTDLRFCLEVSSDTDVPEETEDESAVFFHGNLLEQLLHFIFLLPLPHLRLLHFVSLLGDSEMHRAYRRPPPIEQDRLSSFCSSRKAKSSGTLASAIVVLAI